MRSALFPFSDLRCDYIQRKVVDLIESSDFSFELPELPMDIWQAIIRNEAEKQRLEFLGDALIGSSISELLLLTCPQRNPGFYTKIRMVLVANSTFAHLMRKAGFHDDGDNVKRSGDAFETMLATYHADVGNELFKDYIRKQFTPLIQRAARAFDRYGTLRSKWHHTHYKQHFASGSPMRGPSHSKRIPAQRNDHGKARAIPVVIDLTHLPDDNDINIGLDSSNSQGTQASSSKMKSTGKGFNLPQARQSILMHNPLNKSSHQEPLHIPTFSNIFVQDPGFAEQVTQVASGLLPATAEPIESHSHPSNNLNIHSSNNSIAGLQTWASLGTIDNPITID